MTRAGQRRSAESDWTRSGTVPTIRYQPPKPRPKLERWLVIYTATAAIIALVIVAAIWRTT